jgi:hypothetical protein
MSQWQISRRTPSKRLHRFQPGRNFVGSLRRNKQDCGQGRQFFCGRHASAREIERPGFTTEVLLSSVFACDTQNMHRTSWCGSSAGSVWRSCLFGSNRGSPQGLRAGSICPVRSPCCGQANEPHGFKLLCSCSPQLLRGRDGGCRTACDYDQPSQALTF